MGKVKGSHIAFNKVVCWFQAPSILYLDHLFKSYSLSHTITVFFVALYSRCLCRSTLSLVDSQIEFISSLQSMPLQHSVGLHQHHTERPTYSIQPKHEWFWLQVISRDCFLHHHPWLTSPVVQHMNYTECFRVKYGAVEMLVSTDLVKQRRKGRERLGGMWLPSHRRSSHRFCSVLTTEVMLAIAMCDNELRKTAGSHLIRKVLVLAP